MKTRLFLSLNLSLVVGCVSAVKKTALEQIESSREPASIESIGQASFQKITLSQDQLIYYFRPSKSLRAPIILFVHGSGCGSVMQKRPDGTINSGAVALMASERGNEVAILAVEKPGVSTFDPTNDFSSRGCNEDFLRQFTLDEWTERLKHALTDVRQRFHLSPEKVGVMGVSEGGDVALVLAGKTPSITHAVLMIGGDLAPIYGNFNRAKMVSSNDEKTIESDFNSISRDWQTRVLMKGDDYRSFFRGHTPRYWNSILKISPIDSLKRAQSKFFIVYGSKDPQNPVEGMDALVAQAVSTHKEVKIKRLVGVSHDLIQNGKEIYPDLVLEAVDWILQ